MQSEILTQPLKTYPLKFSNFGRPWPGFEPLYCCYSLIQERIAVEFFSQPKFKKINYIFVKDQ